MLINFKILVFNYLFVLLLVSALLQFNMLSLRLPSCFGCTRMFPRRASTNILRHRMNLQSRTILASI